MDLVHDRRYAGERSASVLPTATLLALLGLMSSFAVDAYLPAARAIGHTFGVSQAELALAMTGYFVGVVTMALVYGPLSEGLGRRPVLLVGTVGFGITSALCAVSTAFDVFLLGRIGQGACVGAGAVVARAVITDKFQDRDAQRAMAMYMTIFAIGPAVAPIIGAAVLRQFGWRTIFWMFAALAVVLSAVAAVALNESLPRESRRALRFGPVRDQYLAVFGVRQVALSLLAVGIAYNAVLIYIVAAPAYLGEIFRLAPSQYFWLFVAAIGGLVAGARMDAVVAKRIDRRRQVSLALEAMVAVAATNVALSALLAPGVVWSLLLLAALAFCWGLLVPAATVLAFQAAPNAKGTASGVQLFTTNCSNLIVSAAVVPLVLRSLVGLAIGAMVLSILASLSWTVAWRPGHHRTDMTEAMTEI